MHMPPIPSRSPSHSQSIHPSISTRSVFFLIRQVFQGVLSPALALDSASDGETSASSATADDAVAAAAGGGAGGDGGDSAGNVVGDGKPHIALRNAVETLEVVLSGYAVSELFWVPHILADKRGGREGTPQIQQRPWIKNKKNERRRAFYLDRPLRTMEKKVRVRMYVKQACFSALLDTFFFFFSVCRQKCNAM